MTSGTVKWFNGPSGYGVIAVDAGGSELFVYRGSLLGTGATLDAGDRVEFEVHEGGMGAQAIDVRHAGAAGVDDGSERDTAVVSRKEG